MADRASRDELARMSRVYTRRRAVGHEDRYPPWEPANLYRLQHLERDLARLLVPGGLLPFGDRAALDAGCGGGWWLRRLMGWGVTPEQLAGVDALPTAVHASAAAHPALRIVRGTLDALPFADHSFDLVSQFTVFSSILDRSVRHKAAAEMRRVLRPGGSILWYDFTVNPTNRDTRGIGAGEIRRLFLGCRIHGQRVTLAPPLGRLVVPQSWMMAEVLEAAPFLRTHLLLLIRPT